MRTDHGRQRPRSKPVKTTHATITSVRKEGQRTKEKGHVVCSCKEVRKKQTNKQTNKQMIKQTILRLQLDSKSRPLRHQDRPIKFI